MVKLEIRAVIKYFCKKGMPLKEIYEDFMKPLGRCVLLIAQWKLEDLKVLKRSPDLLNNVKIGHGHLRRIIQTYFVLPFMVMVAILVKYHIYIY